MSKNDTRRSKEVSTKLELDYESMHSTSSATHSVDIPNQSRFFMYSKSLPDESMHSTSSSTHSVDIPNQSPFFMLPKSLPDIDDNSMNHVFEYIEHYEQDIFWSYLSDLVFIAGGLIYVFLALWDVIWPPDGIRNYYTFDVLAPSVYLLNSTIDMEWAGRIKRRDRVKKNMKQGWEDWRFSTASNKDQSTPIAAETLPWYHRLRKHTAHRRSIMAALTFGIAALFGAGSVLMGYRDSAVGLLWCNKLDSVSDHAYLLSAIITMTGKRIRPWLQTSSIPISNNPEMLEDLGDLLFLLGSLMDAVMGDLNVDDVPIGCLVSSLLWLTDACFYLRSDVVRARQVKNKTAEVGNMLV
jgi:hypothetical protein